MQDRYGLELTTSSAEACDAYADGMDRMLAGDAGAEHGFQRALDADPDFALAKAALARAQQFLGDGRAAPEPTWARHLNCPSLRRSANVLTLMR